MDELTRRLSAKLEALTAKVSEQEKQIAELAEQVKAKNTITRDDIVEMFRGKGIKPTTETKALFDKIQLVEKRVNKIERKAERKTARKAPAKQPKTTAKTKAK